MNVLLRLCYVAHSSKNMRRNFYPLIPEGCLLNGGDAPFDYEEYLKKASVERFEVE